MLPLSYFSLIINFTSIMDIDNLLNVGRSEGDKAIDHLKAELQKIRAGKASPSMLDGVMVEYYGSMTPLAQVSNISTPDSRTLSIQPWEKSLLGEIEQAIFKANLGLTPMNDGEFVRIGIPPLTEERRKEMVKQSKGLAEDCKVSLRNARQKLMEFVKQEVKNGYPEDAGKKKESEIQGLIKNYGAKIEELISNKEKDIMTV